MFQELSVFSIIMKEKLLVLRILYFDETFSSFLDELKRTFVINLPLINCTIQT